MSDQNIPNIPADAMRQINHYIVAGPHRGTRLIRDTVWTEFEIEGTAYMSARVRLDGQIIWVCSPRGIPIEGAYLSVQHLLDCMPEQMK